MAVFSPRDRRVTAGSSGWQGQAARAGRSWELLWPMSSPLKKIPLRRPGRCLRCSRFLCGMPEREVAAPSHGQSRWRAQHHTSTLPQTWPVPSSTALFNCAKSLPGPHPSCGPPSPLQGARVSLSSPYTLSLCMLSKISIYLRGSEFPLKLAHVLWVSHPSCCREQSVTEKIRSLYPASSSCEHYPISFLMFAGQPLTQEEPDLHFRHCVLLAPNPCSLA